MSSLSKQKPSNDPSVDTLKHICGLDSPMNNYSGYIFQGVSCMCPNIKPKRNVMSHDVFREEMIQMRNCLFWNSKYGQVTKTQHCNCMFFLLLYEFWPKSRRLPKASSWLWDHVRCCSVSKVINRKLSLLHQVTIGFHLIFEIWWHLSFCHVVFN